MKSAEGKTTHRKKPQSAQEEGIHILRKGKVVK